jgi:hypothetical protein
MSMIHRIAGLGLAGFMVLALPGLVEAGHRHSRGCGHRYGHSRYDHGYGHGGYSGYYRGYPGYRPSGGYGYYGYGYAPPPYRGSRYGYYGYGYPPPPVYYNRGHHHGHGSIGIYFGF